MQMVPSLATFKAAKYQSYESQAMLFSLCLPVASNSNTKIEFLAYL